MNLRAVNDVHSRLNETVVDDIIEVDSLGSIRAALARALDPDLVLLDVALPDLSGLDVAARLAGGHSKVVLVSSRRPDDFGARFRDAPVLGFISKDELSGAVLAQLLEGSS